MSDPLKKLLAPLASLRLTVVLLALAMLVIYAGTWAQIDQGIWQVQKQYFHSFFTWISFQTFLPRPKAGQPGIPGGFPMLGGYAIGLLLLINLIAAHALRFKATWKDLVLLPGLAASLGIAYAIPPRDNLTLVTVLFLAPLPVLLAVAPLHGKRTGVILVHLGLILLLVGEGITSGFAVESQMTIDEGSYANYSQDIRASELAIIDPAAADHDDVITIPGSLLAKGATIDHPAMPVRVRVEEYFPNSALLGPMQLRQPNAPQPTTRATAGDGVQTAAVAQPVVSGTDGNQVDAPSAYVTLETRGGQNLGTYLVSLFIDRPQEFKVGDKTYQLALRFKRMYKPYTVHLLDFRHDRYVGTDVPKDFSSHVRFVDPRRGVDRELRIWMNNPFRYQGETFFQSGFKPGDRTTILQVVKNPAWTLPYLACAIGAVGLTIHFGVTLLNFVRKQMNAPVPAISAGGKAGRLPLREPAPAAVPWLSRPTLAALALVALVLLFSVARAMKPVGPATPFDLAKFGALPLSHDGRSQPLDSLARNSLKVITGRETAYAAYDHEKGRGQRMSAIRWLTDVFAQPEKASDYPVFRIDNKDINGLLGFDEKRKLFSIREILTSREKLEEQLGRAHEARRNDPKNLDLFQRKVIELGEKLRVYMTLGRMEELLLVPPFAAEEKWQQFGPAMHVADGRAAHPAARAYLGLIRAYHDDKPEEFNRELDAYARQVGENVPAVAAKARFEAAFNRVDPFTHSMALYLTAFLMACVSWLTAGVPLRRAATVGMIVSVVIHSAAILSRMYITGRPPVISNLASVAFFIAWGGVILASVIEVLFRNGIGSAVGSIMGFTALLIGDRLALQGDTMKVLQAVLDTNFWLATHVIIIALGYAATFLAGILGIAWILRACFAADARDGNGRDLTRMIYGVTCFAILFSFVGTVLGGIWADQSWGRFWGWDPKENGAVLIVLANALLLHARWGGIARDRGIAALAVFGNIVTAWSWFGTNMLGVGLHSYGFMESALKWLLAFVVSQILVIALAYLPLPRRARLA